MDVNERKYSGSVNNRVLGGPLFVVHDSTLSDFL